MMIRDANDMLDAYYRSIQRSDWNGAYDALVALHFSLTTGDPLPSIFARLGWSHRRAVAWCDARVFFVSQQIRAAA